MTKSTSPAANTGLPAIDRRSVVCGLGTAAVAGVPALASAAPMSDDPVFQAMAALEQLKIHAEELEAALSIAEDAIFDATRRNVWPYVILAGGEEMKTHEQIDAHFTPAFADEEQLITSSKDFARVICPTPNAPNVTGRAKPLTTNCAGKKRKLPKSNSARDIEKSRRKRTLPTALFGTPNTKSWRPRRPHRLALLPCSFRCGFDRGFLSPGRR